MLIAASQHSGRQWLFLDQVSAVRPHCAQWARSFNCPPRGFSADEIFDFLTFSGLVLGCLALTSAVHLTSAPPHSYALAQAESLGLEAAVILISLSSPLLLSGAGGEKVFKRRDDTACPPVPLCPHCVPSPRPASAHWQARLWAGCPSRPSRPRLSQVEVEQLFLLPSSF